MPRLVDPHARRRLLSEAALALAEADGLQAVTIARVAARSGVSVGNVQHWYPAKEMLLIATYEACLDRLGDRIDAHTCLAENRGATIREMLLMALEEFLPTTPTAQSECRVRAEFHGRAACDGRLADAERTSMAALHGRVGAALRNGRECGETAADLDTDEVAWELLALASGLAGLALHTPVPTRNILLARLGTVLPHECRRSGDAAKGAGDPAPGR